MIVTFAWADSLHPVDETVAREQVDVLLERIFNKEVDYTLFVGANNRHVSLIDGEMARIKGNVVCVCIIPLHKEDLHLLTGEDLLRIADNNSRLPSTITRFSHSLVAQEVPQVINATLDAIKRHKHEVLGEANILSCAYLLGGKQEPAWEFSVTDVAIEVEDCSPSVCNDIAVYMSAQEVKRVLN